jgi:hypothetical protein
MLPILRIIPVGGVLLAIMILVLAFNPPGSMHSPAPPSANAPRGALMSLVEHPEWRQFLILTATKRADELARLSDLPGMPARSNAQDAANIADKFAGLPLSRGDTDPDDQTGAIPDVPLMPVEIGETSSTELPVIVQEERPPVIKTPERVRVKGSQLRTKQRARHVRVKPKPEPAPLNLLEAIFGPSRQPTAGKQSSQPAAAPTPN